MAIKSQKDLAAGLLFTVIGIAFAVGAREYPIGTAARMGPGYFPIILGILMAILGTVIALQSLGTPRDDERIGTIAWRPLLLIVGANVVFGTLLGGISPLGIPSFGLIIAVIALVLMAARASDEFRLKEVVVLAAILAAGSWFVFIQLLNLPIPLWPAFLVN
ncbi:tripartite tricarboxylate transporter TctB family protein [Aquabacterium sp.]|uniref:tripartite tricarboxylate transporter TctB family protein n=1 Tax=Aquabacterium sp. TaxID=1872578 RepID=UPI003BAF2F57